MAFWVLESLEHMGRPCQENLRPYLTQFWNAPPDIHVKTPHSKVDPSSVSHTNTKHFCMILIDTGFSRNEAAMQMKEGLYFVLLGFHCFRKSRP